MESRRRSKSPVAVLTSGSLRMSRCLKVPIMGGSGLAEGIEVFPRQDQLGPDEFGNAIRGPLGIHRATGRRYWFYGADYRLDAQMEYLERLRKITETEMD